MKIVSKRRQELKGKMELFLIRHGIAVARGIYDRDEDRPLTEKGIAKTTLVAQRLSTLGVTFEYIVSSPLIRARQTAKILQQAGLGQEIMIHQSLAPDGEIKVWLKWLSKSNFGSNFRDLSEPKIALIGHQPDLGNWAETLVFGESKERFIVKKAGIIGLKITNQTNPIGNSELFLLTAPKWLTQPD